MNTEQAYWDRWLSETGYSLPENLSVFHVTRETFDHGATRDAGIRQSDAGICVCMTDDALPADQYLLENLVRGLTEKEGTAVAYGRQLPDRDCGIIERYTRAFNYPEESRLKTREDLPELGSKRISAPTYAPPLNGACIWSWAALRKRPSSMRI